MWVGFGIIKLTDVKETSEKLNKRSWMELEFCEVSHISLVTNLVGEVCEGVNEGKVAKSFSLQASKLTEEVWKEIVNYNLDPNAPCFYILKTAQLKTSKLG
ncbi:hypothetical protein N752_11725 [Desulforamulus aquiferis]|nr:hypothetical protein N752_11725 [Desulforamulus aquiferis]